MPPHLHRSPRPLLSRASLLSLVLVSALSACGSGSTPSAATPHATVPTPDLCKVISSAVVTAAMHGRPAGCQTSGDGNGFTARFSGTGRLPGRRAPAALTVSYEPRRDARTGTDRWQTVGRPTGTRVSLIGVGERAVFDPKRAPQLRATQGNLIVSVGLTFTGAPVPQTKLPDNLQAVASEAVAAAR
jgi:hypothetical protein